MKRLVACLFLCLAVSAFALPNPWLRTWIFSYGGKDHIFSFMEDKTVKDVNTGMVYSYKWEKNILYIFCYENEDLLFIVEFSEDGSSFIGVETTNGQEVLGYITF